MEREPEMPCFIAVVQSCTTDDQQNDADGERCPGRAIDTHFPTATNVIEPEKTKEDADRGIDDAVNDTAPVGPGREFGLRFPQLVNIPKSQPGHETNEQEAHQEKYDGS